MRSIEGMRETRKQIKARLQAADLWEDYLELREQLVRKGQPHKQLAFCKPETTAANSVEIRTLSQGRARF